MTEDILPIVFVVILNLGISEAKICESHKTPSTSYVPGANTCITDDIFSVRDSRLPLLIDVQYSEVILICSFVGIFKL